MPGPDTSTTSKRAVESRLANARISRRAGLAYVDDRGRGIRRQGSISNGFRLTTLRDNHVRFTRAGRAVLDFDGKGRTRHRIEVPDPRIAAIVRRCRALQGRRLFQFEDADGKCRPVDSRQVNEYLRAHLGGEFTAKDFRTWGAPLRAVRLLERTAVPAPPTQRNVRGRINEVVRQVAEELRNTPAACRRSYICPSVFDDWLVGKLPAKWSGRRP